MAERPATCRQAGGCAQKETARFLSDNRQGAGCFFYVYVSLDFPIRCDIVIDRKSAPAPKADCFTKFLSPCGLARSVC